GLIDMKGRVYDPLAGRFLTADPVMQAPYWSQGLNRYSYVFNNPINNTDPSGFIADGADYSGVAITGWGAGVTGIAAGIGFSGIGAGALSSVTSAFMPSIGDGSAGSTRSAAAPTAVPKGRANPQGGAGAAGENKGAVGPSYADLQARADALEQRLAEMPDQQNACTPDCYLTNPVHDLPSGARAAMNRGYVYSGAFILGGGLGGRLAGWALTRLGFGAAAGAIKAADLLMPPGGRQALAQLTQWTTGGRGLAGQQVNMARTAELIKQLPGRIDGIRAGGVTKEMARQWAQFYRQIGAQNPVTATAGNPNALPRAQLMQAIADLL
ncbi:MAG TPA: RHS repeat-associated core domain-containing protein, partial [Polyangiaceae bacterium]|nr:RHS repeat-associated core domain-containing protein [Polyangiaceae bacterium]